jgi:hypothetical protein
MERRVEMNVAEEENCRRTSGELPPYSDEPISGYCTRKWIRIFVAKYNMTRDIQEI